MIPGIFTNFPLIGSFCSEEGLTSQENYRVLTENVNEEKVLFFNLYYKED